MKILTKKQFQINRYAELGTMQTFLVGTYIAEKSSNYETTGEVTIYKNGYSLEISRKDYDQIKD